MNAIEGLDPQALLDNLGQAVLIFDGADQLVQFNQAARGILGADLKLIRGQGWGAAAALMNTRIGDPSRTADTAREAARSTGQVVRFQMYRAGEFLPCYIGSARGKDGVLYTIISIEQPDWSALTELMTHYLSEVREAVDSTQGHAELIAQSLKLQKPTDGIDKLVHRIGGFTRIIEVQMHRLGILTTMLNRMEAIRTGRIRESVARSARRIELLEFIGNFIEELDEHPIQDPDTDSDRTSHRMRLNIGIDPELAIYAAPTYLIDVLRDILRNAIMYSVKDTPIYIRAHTNRRDHTVQIDVIDEGFGIRASENERIFRPFSRARQPQIIGEFGYGLSLFLCKYEIEAMNGRIWFQSEERVGTTFSIKLPAWREERLNRGDSSSNL